MTVIKLKSQGNDYINELAQWLDNRMPNPTVDEPQRWTLLPDDYSIQFLNEKDALLFAMTW